MTGTAATPGTTSARHLNLAARILGVLFSPRSTYADIAARPRILGVLVFVILVTGGLQMWFFSSETGQLAMRNAFEQSLRQAQAQGTEIPPEMRQQMAQLSTIAGYALAGAQVVFAPAFLALLALIIRWLFNALLGGEVSFRQVYAVIAHSTVVTTVGAMFTTPLMYFKGEMVSPTQLSVFLPMLDEQSFAAFLLKAIDLLFIWWIANMGIGLAVLYKRRTGQVALTLLGIYLGIALLIAAVRSF